MVSRYLFIHVFTKHLLSTYHVPYTSWAEYQGKNSMCALKEAHRLTHILNVFYMIMEIHPMSLETCLDFHQTRDELEGVTRVGGKRGE